MQKYRFKINPTNKKGFTLIELLVVIAIIGMLSSVVLASLNTARERSRDARRLSDLNQITKALELYYGDNDQYPPRQAYSGTSGGSITNWYNSLASDLSPYLSPLPDDPNGPSDSWRWYYDADSGDNYQTYGMMIPLETSGHDDLEDNDGGYNGSYYEVGTQPSYCINKYGSGTTWIWNSVVCTDAGNYYARTIRQIKLTSSL